MFGLALLGFIVLSALFALAVKKGTGAVGKALGRTVYERHRCAEQILEDGRMPSSWYQEFEQSYAKREAPNPGNREFRIRTRRHCIRRLDGLLKYFDKAPVFESEEARRMLLADLRNTRERWADAVWQEIAPED